MSVFVGLQTPASAHAATAKQRPASTTSATAKPAKATTAPSIALGADIKPNSGQTEQQSITSFEATTGHQLAYTRDYLLWNSPFPTSYEQWLGARGTMPLISVKPQLMNGTAITWASIAAAQPGDALYTQMKAWADKVKAFGYPVYFTFNHEPEAAASNKFGTDTDYIAAWKNFYNVFAAEGVTNARWMWIMTSFAFIVPTTDPRYAWNWYPGDAYVDAIGADAYTAYTCDNASGIWRTLAYQIAGFVKFGAQHPTKPMWLPEFGVVEDPNTPGRKASWITAAQALFKTAGYQQFVGIAYFNETRPGTACDWRVSTSSAAQSAYNALAQDSFYQGSAQFTPVVLAASFTPSCTNLSCTFNGSASTGASPLTYSWDFGDGTGTSTASSPSYTYAAGGTYPVTLTVKDPSGATSTSTQNVTVVAPGPPAAAFTPTCTNLSCSFDGSTSTGATPLTYSWDFGDGSGTSSAMSPSYTYAAGGTYPVSLTITDPSNATSTSTQSVTVATPPPPTASFTSTCTNLSCTFNGSGSSGASPLSYSWDFGDGSGTSTGASPSHAYAAAGTYPVTLTVTDPFGGSGSSTQSVTASLPAISFVGSASTTANASTETVKVPAAVTAGNGLILIATSGTSVALTAPTGWTAVATTSSPTMWGAIWERIATAKDAGTSVAVKFGGVHHGSVELLAYSGTSATSPVQTAVGAVKEVTAKTLTTPSLAATGPGQELLSYWAGRTSAATTLTPPASVTVRSAETGSGGGMVTSASADSATTTPGGLSASISPSAGHSLTWSILLAPVQ